MKRWQIKKTNQYIKFMNIKIFSDPFPHITIHNLLDPKEFQLIWNELIFLVPKMLPPEQTSAATRERGIPRKKGYGIMIDSMFNNKEHSDILLFMTKTVSERVRNASKESSDVYMQLFKHINHGCTLVQAYRNGDYYEPHEDSAVFTAVTLIHKTPKKYQGGELIFPDYNYNSKLENNSTIIFPSVVRHEVTEVKLKTDNPEDARFTISQLLHIG